MDLVLRQFISPAEVPDSDLRALTQKSYAGGQWRTPHVVRTEAAKCRPICLLELFHGPTFAFKDCALQFLGNLFEYVLEKRKIGSAVILGATSGDTGGAALAGVQGKRGVNGLILYPEHRVSRIQELQMLSFNTTTRSRTALSSSTATVSGSALATATPSTSPTAEIKNDDKNKHKENVVHACSVAQGATFDDCQAIVKGVFQDKEFVAQNNVLAVNSINIARVLCQMVYYLYCYFRHNEKLLKDRKHGGAYARSTVRLSRMRFCVPTGNFGDILAGYYCAKYFRLESLFDFVIASNSNDILTRFFDNGVYAPAAEVCATLSPSMDIQVSSNFERFLLDVADGDTEVVKNWFSELKEKNSFEVDGRQLSAARKYFTAWSCDEMETVDTILRVHRDSDYLLCPHTAVGFKVMQKDIEYRGAGEDVQSVVLATAHYGKFVATVQEFFEKARSTSGAGEGVDLQLGRGTTPGATSRAVFDSMKIKPGASIVRQTTGDNRGQNMPTEGDENRMLAALKTEMPKELADLDVNAKALLGNLVRLPKSVDFVRKYVVAINERGVEMNDLEVLGGMTRGIAFSGAEQAAAAAAGAPSSKMNSDKGSVQCFAMLSTYANAVCSCK
eukprot:g15894.t1